MPRFGSTPLRADGTEYVVVGETEVIVRYQFELRARRAKFGKRRASICSFAFISEMIGNSSHMRKTTGVDASTFVTAACTSFGNTRLLTFELRRKAPRKTSEAPARIVRNERAIGTRHAATAIATPITIAPTISTAVPSTPLRFSACTPKTAPSPARKT